MVTKNHLSYSPSLADITDLVKALDLKLTEEEIKAIEDPYVPRKVFGHS